MKNLSKDQLTRIRRSGEGKMSLATSIPGFVAEELSIEEGDEIIWDVMRGVEFKMGVFRVHRKSGANRRAHKSRDDRAA